MMESSARRFTLLDAMVLLVAISVPFPGALRQLDNIGQMASMKGFARDIYQEILSIVYEFLGFLTLAIMPLRLRRPRPPFRLLVREPGATAIYVPLLLCV